MPIAGLRRNKLTYEMFDIARSADEARRLAKCERIYHRGQDLAWNGKEVFSALLEKHGGIHVADARQRRAIERIYTIILWGELAAWKVSAQLADGLEPLEAKMAATSQAHDEARHFYVMHDYLEALGHKPRQLERAPEALLELVLGTKSLAHKLLGMQLMVETLALTVFQTVRERDVEPVLTDLMRYFEKDEARHVGLGMQYLPTLMRKMSRREVASLITFQARIMTWALMELKLIEPDLRALGIEPRLVMERGRKKQMVAMGEAFDAMGLRLEDQDHIPAATILAAGEFLFPEREFARPMRRLQAAWTKFRSYGLDADAVDELAVHHGHELELARPVTHAAE
ncbi:MAG: ferritin-like domain-containing protein [Myxococcota bacterium]